MPHSLSAKKRVRQNEKRRLRNRRIRSAAKTEVRKFLAALETGDVEASQTQFRAAARALDKATTKGALHANTAARRKSRLAGKLNAVLRARPTAPEQEPEAAPEPEADSES